MAEEPQSDQSLATPAHRIRIETNLEGLEYDETPVLKAVRSVLDAEQCTEAEIDIILVDDEYLRELKHEFFGQDVYTDVIAFRLNSYEESKVEGEVYISLHRAAEQAMEYDVTADMEILRLAIHGILHLLGYEDDTDEKKAIMTSKEDRHLASFDEPLIVQHLP
ncbi:MAG: rRNA maturation RNase YbeY [Candidatus Marinimicrobia bacterium]|nr:rRNA maturation RNase YbeY [Candidatus Neomarinimicrobiota bacterium]MCF7830143.1 rRNA maturation RNase YbeY [Candidatus Neomarinimicrobiota bacterium]MCF7882220.1 rRNA maturation RNase YbeY [Candidatus Neomarinimicrobiota bacterium]